MWEMNRELDRLYGDDVDHGKRTRFLWPCFSLAPNASARVSFSPGQ